MRILKTKKGVIGTIFNIALVMMAISILLYAMIQFHNKYKMRDEFMQERELGDFQMLIKNSIQQGEKALYFVDNSAKFAVGKAIYSLAWNGGYYQYFDTTDDAASDIETKARISIASPCGTYAGYNLWNNKDKDCYPKETLSQNFDNIFYEGFSLYLVPYKDYQIEAKDFNLNYVKDEKTGEEFLSGMSNRVIGVKMIDIKSEIEQRNRIPQEGISQGNPAEATVSGGNTLIWPLDNTKLKHFTINSCFGDRSYCTECIEKNHKAIDIGADLGDKVFAVDDGKVIDVGGTFNTVTIQHKNNLISLYLHNSFIYVKKGDEVTKGTLISKVGKYGPKGPNTYRNAHLDFRLKKDGNYIDPIDPKNGYYNIESLKLTFAGNCIININQFAYNDLIKKANNLA